jgi:predicted alpha/beta hydrolase
MVGRPPEDPGTVYSASNRSKRAPSAAPPGDGSETIEIHTRDGRALRASVREPRAGTKATKPHGVAVLAHAMMARRIEFERPRGGGLARFLSERGWRTIAFDFRGHGDSGPGAAEGARWTYDDLLVHDLPAVVACARARIRRGKVVVVGHSLGGHIALASQATGRLDADAIAMFGANVWLPSLEPSPIRWIAKRAIARMIDEVCDRRGYFPARALRLGSDDESSEYMRATARIARERRWQSEDGREDYFAALGDVTIPVLAVASDGDRINCHPDCAERFLARTRGPKTFHRITQADDGGRAPGHMEMVTTERAKSAWAHLEGWMRGVS